jgi:hypothetical protein
MPCFLHNAPWVGVFVISCQPLRPIILCVYQWHEEPAHSQPETAPQSLQGSKDRELLAAHFPPLTWEAHGLEPGLPRSPFACISVFKLAYCAAHVTAAKSLCFATDRIEDVPWPSKVPRSLGLEYREQQSWEKMVGHTALQAPPKGVASPHACPDRYCEQPCGWTRAVLN